MGHHEHDGGRSGEQLRTHFEVVTFDEADSLTRFKNLGPSSCGSSLESIVMEKDIINASLHNPKEAPAVSKQGGSPPQSYMMGRPAGYDPTRIPSAVFASKPTTPMEWSVASNESLFSIHVGNSSFTRDHIFLLGKSGELPRLDEWIEYPASLPPVIETGNIDIDSEIMGKSSGESINILDNMPPDTEELNMKRESEDMEKGSGVTEASAETTKVDAEDHSKEKMAPTEEVHYSDGSVYSAKSFAFQVFPGEGEGNSSVEVEIANDRPKNQFQQQSHPQNAGATPRAAQTSWFSCFTCCSLR